MAERFSNNLITTFNCRLPKDLKIKIMRLAKKRGVSISDVAREALEAYIVKKGLE